ncbi:2-succinyl-6-hydroxy-2,4-cyclohexadiene-1-carboxylate synthase [compost metagenome]
MNVFAHMCGRIEAAISDAELRSVSAGLDAKVGIRIGALGIGIVVHGSTVLVSDNLDNSDVLICAEKDAWEKVLASPPPPTFHSFTALQLANPLFDVSGDAATIARCRAMLERLFELVVHAAPLQPGMTAQRDPTRISGRYASVTIDGIAHQIYSESSGTGQPVLFLHTAGADSRQFHGQLSDHELMSHYGMTAPDLPFHGKSMPSPTWRGETYKLSKELYLSWCEGILRDIIGEPAIVVGGSMGAAMALVLAAEKPELVKGVVAIEPPFQSKGRRNPFQHHANVHGALHNASYVRGLMSPLSPEANRRHAAWIYSQGAPGIYPGDLAFYSDEFDGAIVGPKIDCDRTPVVLLCGDYDYSASPADGQKLLEVMHGASMIEMHGLGHFPMCENPDAFRPHLLAALQAVS